MTISDDPAEDTQRDSTDQIQEDSRVRGQSRADPSVRVHVHHAMTGTFPLRIADVCFTDDGAVIPEYAYLTPMFGIARRKGQSAANTARTHIEAGGLDALRQYANSTTELAYADIDAIRVHDGGRIGRPKLAIHPTTGAPYGYRLHAPVDVDELAGALEAIATTHDIDVNLVSGVGFSPRASLHRFLAGR